MAVTIRQRDKPAPLSVQVTQAERRVLYHRRMVVLRASRLGRNIRRQVTSPATLLWAGGLGFAAGHLTKRQASTPSETERRRGSHNKLFGRALKLIALARILSRAFPSAATDPGDPGP
jgi:hypothetical protein